MSAVLNARLQEMAANIGLRFNRTTDLLNGNKLTNDELTTAAKSNLVAAINEVNVKAGTGEGAVDPGDLTLIFDNKLI